MRASKLFTAFATACLCLPVGALALTSTEPPDLTGNLAIPDPIGTLDTGVNTVSGSVLAECEDEGNGIFRPKFDTDDGDSFEFQVPSGEQLISAELTIAGLSGGDVFARSFEDLKFLGGVGAGSYDILDGPPLTGTQDYQVAPLCRDDATISYNWVIELEVSGASDQTAPTADAGPDQTGIASGSSATLDATASSDPDAGDTLSY
uniref:hypothetical protein n=1 Tax=Roseovarius halophilus (ex Wu et al. 2025) TaxID=3376060 RepID=UPI003999F6FE